MTDALPSTTPRAGERDQTDVVAAVVDAVADANDASPLEMDPLAAVVDPDALGALFRDGAEGGSIRFRYAGQRVRVDSDGGVAVSDCDD
ncbi:HalOD1 output domain-containing protein [Halomicrobium salinisoli]|uniref:HalOD1 output domain-containing protein n=1 Tax=Halomicrobium salinisoli TaxID=2878391 RepID=UPI001CF0CBAF|nr:HalOD1 output domain-containing protein [Halomicrobium salinisoli]